MWRLLVGGFVVLVVLLSWTVLNEGRTASSGRVATATISPTANIPATVAAQVQSTTQAYRAEATTAALHPTEVPSSVHPAIGEVGFLYALSNSGTAQNEVPVTGTSTDFVAYLKAARAHDDVGLKQMLQRFQIMTVRAGTKARVIDTLEDPIDLAEVRFIDGQWLDTTAWIDHTWIVRQLPKDFVAPTVVPH